MSERHRERERQIDRKKRVMSERENEKREWKMKNWVKVLGKEREKEKERK